MCGSIPVVRIADPAGRLAGGDGAPAERARPAGEHASPTSTVSYETLQDSPVFAGRHFRSDPAQPRCIPQHRRRRPQGAGADPGAGAGQAPQRWSTRRIKLFGGRALRPLRLPATRSATSSAASGSSISAAPRIATGPGYFTDYDDALCSTANCCPHELVHSWNGKYRRPRARPVDPDYRTPLNNTCCGCTKARPNSGAIVLDARSGMGTKQDVLDEIAIDRGRPRPRAAGRDWRRWSTPPTTRSSQNRAAASRGAAASAARIITAKAC